MKNTFIVTIDNTQHQSWQGSIEWVQKQKKQSFRSAMEMIELMESVVMKEETESSETQNGK